MERKDILSPVPENVQRLRKEQMLKSGMIIPRDFLGSVEEACRKIPDRVFEVVVLEDGLKKQGR